MFKFLISIILSYLIGCINPAYLLAKFKGFDIRKKGTKNAGTLNTFQTLGLIPAFFVFIIDAGKGILSFYLAKEIFLLPELYMYFSSLFVIIGHRYPFYLNFKGGKGVAAGIGLFFAAFAYRSTLQYWAQFDIFLLAVYFITRFLFKK